MAFSASAGRSINQHPVFRRFCIDDVAVWNEALTAGEIKGLYDVGMSVDLSYTADKFDLLKQRHDLATGSTTIDSLEWTYATGLAGPAGLTSGPGGYTLVLDADKWHRLDGHPRTVRRPARWFRPARPVAPAEPLSHCKTSTI
jgi:hypothetical protein